MRNSAVTFVSNDYDIYDLDGARANFLKNSMLFSEVASEIEVPTPENIVKEAGQRLAQESKLSKFEEADSTKLEMQHLKETYELNKKHIKLSIKEDKKWSKNIQELERSFIAQTGVALQNQQQRKEHDDHTEHEFSKFKEQQEIFKEQLKIQPRSGSEDR